MQFLSPLSQRQDRVFQHTKLCIQMHQQASNKCIGCTYENPEHCYAPDLISKRQLIVGSRISVKPKPTEPGQCLDSPFDRRVRDGVVACFDMSWIEQSVQDPVRYYKHSETVKYFRLERKCSTVNARIMVCYKFAEEEWVEWTISTLKSRICFAINPYSTFGMFTWALATVIAFFMIFISSMPPRFTSGRKTPVSNFNKYFPILLLFIMSIEHFRAPKIQQL